MKIWDNVKEKKTFEDDLAIEIKKLRKNYLENDPEDSLPSKEDDRLRPGHASKPKSSRLKKQKNPMKSQKKKTLGKNSSSSKLVTRLNLESMPNVKRIAAIADYRNWNKIISKPSKVYSSA